MGQGEAHRDLSADRGTAPGGARLCIDLGALAANYAMLQRRAGPVPCAAVIKADAYGLGAERVAGALAMRGCRHFFVAHLGEAIAVRPHLPPDARIYVLNGLQPGCEQICAAADIVPVLNSAEQARAWTGFARALDRALPAALQMDSGMSRLGLCADEARALAADRSFQTHVALELVMSHLACADMPEHPANRAQLDRFAALAALFPGTPRSIANSGGVLLEQAFHLDMVRAGIALYGADPTEAGSQPMRPVVALDAPVIQLRTIAADTGVGYGLTFRAPSPSRIVTIGIGYADGWPRTLGNRGAAWFGDRRLPIVGRISMDSVTLDATALPRGAIGYGDRVELIGPHQSIETIAADAGTIAYEILTGLGDRFERVYRDAAPVQQMRTI